MADKLHCKTCGLRVQHGRGGWFHLLTVAGREANADHAAIVPQDSWGSWPIFFEQFLDTWGPENSAALAEFREDLAELIATAIDAMQAVFRDYHGIGARVNA